MPIYTGTSQVNPSQIIIDGKQMSKVYVGDKLVWQKILASLGYGLLYNFWCTQDQVVTNNYGYLYNFYAATDNRKITSSDDWIIPAYTDLNYNQPNSLFAYLGGASANTGKLKEVGLNFWDDPNLGATNELLFNGRGAGMRSGYDGIYKNFKQILWIHSSFESGTDSRQYDLCTYNTNTKTNGGGGWDTKRNGKSIRLMRRATPLTHGQTGTYTGNDGKVYHTICIGTQEWLSENLMETKYRDGSLILEVTDNTAWSALSTGGRCSYNNLESNAGTTKRLANSGYHVPTYTELTTLQTALGGSTIAGGKLKEVGLTHWNSPNTGATNDVGFNGIGSGRRNSTATFELLKSQAYFLSSTPKDATTTNSFALTYNNAVFGVAFRPKVEGASIRLIKDSTTLSNGQNGTYTQNDGTVLKTICINGVEWLAENLKETKWSDGSSIPEITDNSAWSSLSTPAMCAFNNDWSNV